LSFLPMKQDRFVYHVYPFAVSFVSVCIVLAFGRIVRLRRYSTGVLKGAVLALCLVLAVASVGANAAVALARFRVSFPATPDWRGTCAALKGRIGDDDVV